jgi:hypothetical protein
MKALTLTQPYATLVAIGAKRYETRSWAPPAAMIGKRIVIHAAKTYNGVGGLRAYEALVDLPHFADALGDAWARRTLPRGQIVASAVIAEVRLTEELIRGAVCPSLTERAFGDYSAGRFAWHLVDVVPAFRKVYMGGRQKLWNVPPGTPLPLPMARQT